MGLFDFLKPRSPPSPKVIEYQLEWLAGESGLGYTVRNIGNGQRLLWQALLPDQHGMLAFNVAGVSHRKAALQDQRFSPGRYLKLELDPHNHDDPEAIAVWSEDRKFQIGYVPKDLNSEVRDLLREGRVTTLCMWETRTGADRVGIRALMVRESSPLDLPRRD